jgi:hypothetical protein
VRFKRRLPCGCIETTLRTQNGKEKVVETARCPADAKAQAERDAKAAAAWAEVEAARLSRVVDPRMMAATGLAVMRALTEAT